MDVIKFISAIIFILNSIASLASGVRLLWEVIVSIESIAFIREFLFIYKNKINYALTAAIIYSFAYLQILLIRYNDKYGTFILLLFLFSFSSLLLSFFIRQNKMAIHQYIISLIENIVERYGHMSAAIKFDIDRIVAINECNYTVGREIMWTWKKILRQYETLLKKEKKVISYEIPGSDEVIWILPNTTVDRAAEIADNMRKEMERRLSDIHYYEEVRQCVIEKLMEKEKGSPLTEKEMQNIGTVSAGVAAYKMGAESLLINISAAVKEAKKRGRNCVVIHS